MAGRPMLALVSLVLLAGGILLQFFTVLSGSINSAPLNKFYFLEAATDGIADARNPSRWTFFAICGVDPSTGLDANCGKSVPALPFDPPRNFGTQNGIPEQFIGTHKYYLLSRFMFAFYLVALIVALSALLTGALALCSRVGNYLSAMTTFIAVFFQGVAATLMTVWVVKGRDIFRSAGHEAHVGKYLMAFAWASTAAFLLATVTFCSGGKSRHSGGVSRKRSSRSAHSRGSFLDKDRRSRDDYS